MTDEGRLFKRIAKHHYRLMLNEVDGVMWMTNSYWAVAVPYGTHPLAKMLHTFNLPLEPAALMIGDTIMPDPLGKVPDIAKLLVARPDDLAPIQPHSFHGAPLYGRDYDGERIVALYDLPGGRLAALNDEYRRFVEAMTPGEWWGGSDPLMKPIFRLHDGNPTALIMGVRCRASEYVPPAEDDDAGEAA